MGAQTSATTPASLGPEVSLSTEGGDGRLPLFIEARDQQLRTSLPDAQSWLRRNRSRLDELLIDHGALVYRGFPVAASGDFRDFVSDYGFANLTYTAGATKRGELDENVYEATALPPDVLIPLHQEMAYLSHWPERLAFFCHVPSDEGGETIIGDIRRIEADLPDEVRDGIRESGIIYRRNFRAPNDAYSHHPTLDAIHKPWTDAFGTESKEDVEAHCAELSLDFEWEPDGSLTTEYRSPGYTDHPTLGKRFWFNQLHAQSMALRTYGPTNWALIEEHYPPGRPRPYETLLGDRSPIPASWIDAIYDAMDTNTVAFPWQAGDVMVVDNVLTAHGRNPFRGKRDIQVAMLA